MSLALAPLADASRCAPADELCQRIHRLEPALPIRPLFQENRATPCLTDSVCLPAIHVLTGWHMLHEEGIVRWMAQHPLIEIRSGGGCFNLWKDHLGAAADWVKSWGGPPANDSTRIAAVNCAAKTLTWHPEYAGRYWTAAATLFERCKSNTTSAQCGRLQQQQPGKAAPSGADPRLSTHTELIGNGGVGHEATPPFVMRALYGRHVRLIVALRSPVDRIETAFWFHKQFWAVKGPSADGLHAYATEQVAGFRRCEAMHSSRRCAFLFERLSRDQADVFWHCNQIIRGLYHPFIAEWRAAFPSELLVLRVEDVFGEPALTSARLSRFLSLPTHLAPHVSSPLLRRTYAEWHVASLNVSCCGGGRGEPEPMRSETHRLLTSFYAPFNQALAALLDDPLFEAWRAADWRPIDLRTVSDSGRS